MTESFYLIWRNRYTRQLIRNILCHNFIINVNKEYLIENHRFLSVFSSKDKLDYNITICFKGDAGDYLNINHINRDVINDVEIDIKSDVDNFDLNEIHDGVHKLSLMIEKRENNPRKNNRTSVATGELPSSITYLNLCGKCQSFAQAILSNLPANLKELELKIDQNSLSGPCIMPQSLTKLKSSPYLNYENLKWFVVPPNKVYKSCMLYIDSMESFEWLFANKWICNIGIDSNMLNILTTQHKLPPHVTKLGLYDDIVLDSSFLPQTLESLTCGYGTPISHLTHLKSLTISSDYPFKLEKGDLPASLQELNLYYNHSFGTDVLPPHLTTLDLYGYDQPLYPNVLPPRLTTLFLNDYNQPLCVNVLPSSLTDLHLDSFNRPLDPFVLPSKLKSLSLQYYTQPTFPPNSLPVSLTSLTIYGFKGSFEQCQPLDNLRNLKVDTLVPSLSTLLTNVKKLSMWVYNKDDDKNDRSGIACLYNTSIKSLHLYFCWLKTLYPNTFPPTLKYLTLVKAHLKSNDVIPRGCVLLKSKYL
ncbi:hypothetical protein CYY_000243 [Polysphondylium violaceum]|uniref:FNIP repeat-containing protein n=1 Tax=Polysphondylium violaceum TaxID=133409 RepID=A0A8J4V5W4_9MYCE|nr:hypothetical protein CYY_000243 [Polysphondylium violaceum]